MALVNEKIGGGWLLERFGIVPVQPLRQISLIGRTPRTTLQEGVKTVTFRPDYRPADTLEGHLAFMLDREPLHLEFLARLFGTVGPSALTDWIRRTPAAKNARRGCFFYEWLTGSELEFRQPINAGYIDAIPSDLEFTATEPINVPKWRVRDNLPGTAEFCPTIRIEEFKDTSNNILEKWTALEQAFGRDLLMRSSVWLTTRESRASFAIEREGQRKDRIKRFAAAMEEHLGTAPDPLDTEFLADIQAAILGEATTRRGLRRSPVFIGETSNSVEIVHFIGPHWEWTPGMLRGLSALQARTKNANPVLRAAAISFGFVYIHPMADGNGRISRFLVNDVLRRDDVIRNPYVLPISASILADRISYDRVLDAFSKPFMRRYAANYRFGKEVAYPDGVVSNLEFNAYEDAKPAWRYPDLTAHAKFTEDLIWKTLEVDLPKQARLLMTIRRARAAVNDIIEGPDQDLDRIIRSVRENGVVTGKLKADFPILEDENIAQEIVSVVTEAYQDLPEEGPW